MGVIGGEFRIESDVLQDKIKNQLSPMYSLGRTCFSSILESIKNHWGGITVLLPDYLCSSIVEVPLSLKIPIEYYHVTDYFIPDVDSIIQITRESKSYALLLISYFGLVDLDKSIREIRSCEHDLIIIVDDVQNYYGFGKHYYFDYCFTSYRKWFAVPDGADLIINPDMPDVECQMDQAGYVLYKAAGNLLKNHNLMIGDSISLELIDKGEKMMSRGYHFTCSDLSRGLLQRTDIDKTAEKRRRNAKYLHEGLNRLNIQHLYDPKKVPLFVPIVIEKRDEIRKGLFSEQIFAPIHWPVIDSATQGNNELYRRELSLICDQRYDEEDMERILRGIENAM